MKNKLIIIFLLFCHIATSAQDNNLKNEILNYQQSKSVIISQGRSMLIDKFIAHDLAKVKEIKDYLINDVSDSDLSAFYPAEYWLILYWTSEYDELINQVKGFDSTMISAFQNKIKPMNDLLFQKIQSRSISSLDSLTAAIYNAEISQTDKQFLAMNLQYLLFDETQKDITQNNLNDLADNFLTNNPHSPYEDYTRRYIRYKMVPSKWGLGVEFFSGYAIYTGNISNIFQNNIPFGVAFDIGYKDFTFYLRDYIGVSKTKTDIYYQTGRWDKGSGVTVFLPELSVGYTTLDNRFVKIAPFAGIASMDITPTQADIDDNKDLENADLGFKTTYTAGLNVDFKLGRSRIPMITYNGQEDSYWMIRVRYAFNVPRYEQRYPDFGGNMHYITIGIGGFGRKIKRDY